MRARAARPVRHRPAAGFTLIEMLITVVLLSTLAALGMGLFTMPARGFADLSRRATLVDQADSALTRMSRELRHALPNSVRTALAGTRTAIEYLNTSGGGRYRAQTESGGGGDPLVNGAADTFDVLGPLLLGSAVATGAGGQGDCLSGVADCLVIYNTGTGAADFNAYQGDNIATVSALGANQLSFDNGAGWSFPFVIPPTAEQRFFIVDTPVSFVCDTALGQLLRYGDYPIGAVQPVGGADFTVAPELLAENVVACQFGYNPGAGARHGLVTLRVVIGDAAGEQIALLHQVHVANVP